MYTINKYYGYNICLEFNIKITMYVNNSEKLIGHMSTLLFLFTSIVYFTFIFCDRFCTQSGGGKSATYKTRLRPHYTVYMLYCTTLW